MELETLLIALVAAPLPLAVLGYLGLGVLPPWWKSAREGLGVGFFDVLRMRFESINAWQVVCALAAAHGAGYADLSHWDFADAYLENLDLERLAQRFREAGSHAPRPTAEELFAQQRQAQGLPAVEEVHEDDEELTSADE